MVFRSDPLAEMKNLEFLYAYNAGGTMTESSNYDEAANSSPPAYGAWKQTTYTSTVGLAMFDKADAPISGGGDGTGAGTRIAFQCVEGRQSLRQQEPLRVRHLFPLDS